MFVILAHSTDNENECYYSTKQLIVFISRTDERQAHDACYSTWQCNHSAFLTSH